MALFQNSVLNKYIKLQDQQAVEKAYKKYTKYFHNTERQQNIRDSKEEQFQEGFLTQLFVNVLGYTLNPEPNFNLTTELKNEKNAKKTDGAILKNGQALAVIELKSTKTKDLESIRQQAFDYKANQTGCVYVITSNFEKIRFYINNAVDFEEFNLFTLNLERFTLMYLCLHQSNLLNNIPLKIKTDSVIAEEKITKTFYNDYSVFKRELFRDLVKQNMNNEIFRNEIQKEDSEQANKNIKLVLFKTSQKLIDRFLFIFFAEDRGLLPPNSTLQILKKWKADVDFGDERPLYNLFKTYFHFLDTGRKGTDSRAEIFAYNGGLFKPDAILDSLIIDDELLYKHTKQLSDYDFDSQVDVNILGHIFENSLNEIESVNAEIEGTDFDKQKTKRKKDGVFYTPKYITKYIVDNTIGKLCTEKKDELKILEEDFNPKRQKETKKKLLASLETYREWLLQLTICDPACGSGAFLNQALDFLIKEHQDIDELQTNLLGGGLVFPNIENTVLENNIFGVDLNEESVEIAKLSLWLRTAQPRRKLNTLNNNIKCGNSLIDSKTVAGDKAFNWETEFPQVFEEKEKKAYHITTATHNSRYSQRMFDYKVKIGNAEWIDEEDEIIITKTIAEIVKEDKLNVIEYNVCGDHMHILLVCEEEEIPKIVGKIKAMTSRARNIAKGYTIPKSESDTTTGHAPLSHADEKKERGETQTKLWTQKFGNSEIKDEEYLANAIEYIRNNREKHELPKNKAIESLKKEFLCTTDHAFRTEKKGGFDVVIGNPPYVRAELLGGDDKNYFDKHYFSPFKQYDIYVLFYEKGVNILRENGILGFITPNKFYLADYGKKIRKYLLKNTRFERIADVSMMNIFPDASVYPTILVFTKSNSNNENIVIQPKVTNVNQLEFDVNTKISQKIYIDTDDSIINTNVFNFKILKKIDNKGEMLGNIFKMTRGFRPPKTELIKESSQDGVYPYLIGEALSKPYNVKWNGKYVEYIASQIPESKPLSVLKEPKVMIRDIGLNFNAYFDEGHFFCLKTIYFVYGDEIELLKYLTCVLNSKMMNFYFKERFSSMHISGGYLRFRKQFVEKMPINIEKNKISDFNYFCDTQTKLNSNNQRLLDKFTNYLKSQFALEKLSRKLQNWHELDFSEFIKELNKAIKKVGGEKLTKTDEMDWMDVFETKKAAAQTLKTEIDKTDVEIDQMVYELYGLSEEEIKIVEEN